MTISFSRLRSILGLCISIAIMFTYVYPLHFVFLPVSTRYLLAFLGIIFIVTNKKLLSKYITGVVHFLPVLFFSFITLIVNQTSEFGIGTTPIIYSLSFFSAIGVIGITKSYEPQKFIDLLVAAVALQMLLGLFFFINPNIESSVNSLLVQSDLAKESMEDSFSIRIRGLGTAFFSSGVVNCIALIVIALYYNPSRKIYLFFYFLIVLIGIFMSRTTIIGFLISIPILLKRLNVSFKSVMIGTFALIGTLYVIGTNLKNSEEQKYLNLFNFGFAIINDYEDSKKLNTGDLDAISYNGRLPNNIKTWVIGDGLLADPMNPTTAYYKGVDQGYLRSLYFFGILGTLSLLVGYYLEVLQVVRHNKNKLFYLLFFLYVIIMYKGLIDIFQFIIPFYIIRRAETFKLKQV